MDESAYREADRRSLWHPYTRHSAAKAGAFPIIVRGEGIHLYDAGGRRYLDAISSWWCCNLGHGHPRLVEAMIRQARELQHSILGNLSHPRAIELAEALAELFPGAARRVFFASDGASAVEAALKIAVQYWWNAGRPERHRFVALAEGYHGDTLGAASAGYVESFHRPFCPLLFPCFQAEAPRCAACRHGRKPADCDAECFASMETIVERHADEIAAAIVEPMCQGAAGMRMYPAEYLRKLAALCRRHGILLIADEIAMGYGRTGRMFAFEHAGVDPDIVCLGKALAGGYLPMSATVVTARIYDAFADEPQDGTFYHGHTFAGNPVAAAVALETLRVYAEEGIVDQAERAGRVLAAGMETLRAVPGVADVRCLGMIGAVELAPDDPRTPPRPQRIRARLLDQGILIRPLGHVVYLMLPLVTPEAVVRETVRELGQALESA